MKPLRRVPGLARLLAAPVLAGDLDALMADALLDGAELPPPPPLTPEEAELLDELLGTSWR